MSTRPVRAGLLALTVAAALPGCATRPVPASAAPPTAAAPEAPAYLIVLGRVHDRQAFLEGYAAKLPPLYARYGGQYVAIGAAPEVLEGDMSATSFVLARWPSMAAARAFWTSPEYDALRRARIDNGWGDFQVLLVPGLPAPVQTAPGVRAVQSASSGVANTSQR